MTQKKTFGSKSLKIKVKDDKVMIIFNAQNWKTQFSEYMDAMAVHAENRGIPVADYMGHALKLKLREISPTQDSFDQFMRLCDELAVSDEAEQPAQNHLAKANPAIGEP